MKKLPVIDFLQLLDDPNMLNITFLGEILKACNLEGDVFFFDIPKNDTLLQDNIRKIAKYRKWKLRNLTILHRRHKLINKKGEFCLMVTTKTPEQFADCCNRLYRMRAFL